MAKNRLNAYELPESFDRTLALIYLLYPLVNYRHRDNLLTTDFIFRNVNTQLMETSYKQLCVIRDVQIPVGTEDGGGCLLRAGECTRCFTKGMVRKEESG